MTKHVKQNPFKEVIRELKQYYLNTKRVEAHINVGDCPEHR